MFGVIAAISESWGKTAIALRMVEQKDKNIDELLHKPQDQVPFNFLLSGAVD